VTRPESKAGRRMLAVTAAIAALLVLAACSSSPSAAGTTPSAVRTVSTPDGAASVAPAVGSVSRPRPGPACDVLTQQIADEILGQPTTVLDSESSSAGADCQRAGTRDVDDQVEYGWQKPGTAGYETPDQRAAGCQGKVSRPAEFGTGAVLCQYRPQPLEADWLGWTINGVLYIVVIHVDDQELPADATFQTAHLLTS
jgi:hypothetical protein